MKIPFCKPYPWDITDRKQILSLIDNRLTLGRLVKGDFILDLEETIKKYYNVKYCIATSSCTMGLYLCYKFYEWLGPIHIPSFTWPSFYRLLDQDVCIMWHDINKETWLMNGIGDIAGIIIPTHTFGNIIKVKRSKNNIIIQDSAHSLGSKIKDFKNVIVISLAATKIITSCDGGLVLTNNKELAEFIRERRDLCARLSELHAIVGLHTLQYLDDVLEWKREVFEYYSEKIPGQFQEIPIDSNYNTIGFLNVENLKIPDTFEYRQYYIPIKKGYPNSEYVYERIICLPSFFNVDYKKIVKDILEVNKL